jgi:predicted CoA-binding protein
VIAASGALVAVAAGPPEEQAAKATSPMRAATGRIPVTVFGPATDAESTRGNRRPEPVVDRRGMTDIAKLLDAPGTTVALVGATDNKSKYGNIIYRDLRRKGFKVFAVNPGRESVEGDPCWASLADLPEKPTIVNIVVPPQRTLRVLDDCEELGLDNIWIQPGAADAAVRKAVVDKGFNALIDACIMVMAREGASSASD